MIKDFSHAAMLAHNLAGTFLTGEVSQEMFNSMFEDPETCEQIFAQVRKYKFTGESLYLHHCGQNVFQFVFKETQPPSWLECDDDFRLSLTLYCANVPILAAFIPPEEVKQEPPPADPRRGFDSILKDDDNRGTIYDKETLRAAQGETQAEDPPSAEVTSGNAIGNVLTAQAGAAPGTGPHDELEQVTQNTDSEAELGEDPAAQSADPAPADPAPAAEAQPDKPVILAKPNDGDDDPYSGGDVVDEEPSPFDEDDADAEVVGDEPPTPKARKKRR